MDRFSSLAGDNNDHTPSPAKKQKLVAESSKLGRKPSLRKPILSPRSGIERTKQQHCHYCTGALKGDDYVRCTKLTKSRPGSRLEPCEKAYCQRHLAKVYGTSVSEARAAVFDPSLAEEHAADQGYVWTCFHCRGLCVGKHCVRRRIHIGQTKPVPSTSYSPPSALRSATTENTAKSVFPAAGHVSNPIPDPTIAASHHRHSTAPQFLITPRAERSIGPKYDPQATGSLELAGHKDRHGSRPPLPDTSTALERNGSGSKAAATTQRNCSNMPCPAFDTHESCASATDLPSSDLSAPHGTLNADIPVPARDESMTPLPGSYLHPLSLILDRQRVSLPSRESSLVASNRPVMLMPMPHAAPSALGRHDPVTPFTMPQQGPRASDRGTSAAARHVLPKSGRHESETQHSDLTRQPPLGISISGWGRPLPTTRPITIPPPLYIPYHPTILRPLTIHDQIRPSHDFGFGSELGFSGPVDMMAERFAQVGSNAKRKSVGLREKLADVQAKIQAQALRKKKDSIATNGSKTKEAAKPVQAGTGKDKSKDAEGKAKIPRAKPVPKPEVPVDPPIFEKVDTRLGREGAEYRLMFREYMVRFQAVLAIPDRSLPPLDDFDRPLSEASMRIFVGAMLGLIKEELEADNGDEDVLELLSRHREELRYHGDFARFANTFKVLTKPLGLRMPLALPTTGVAANTQAVRDLLGLNEDGNPPADEPTHRSVTSGRIPSQHEVVRMLLALAERTISTPKIRRDLMWEAPENEARRTHQQQVKRENHRHEDVNKALAEARVVCKSPSAMIANTKETEQENLEHVMQLSLADVNLRAALGLRALRQGPLGVDLDGRIYYCLQHRSVDDDSRPPDAWASDLLVWGIGVPSKPGTNADEDELPVFTERWCHFGKSSEVEQLVKWIEYRLRVALRAAQSPKTPTKATSKPATPQTLKSVRATKPSTPRGVDKTPITPALIKTSKNVQPVTPTDRTVNAKTTPKAVPNVFPRWVTSTPKQTTPKSGTTPRTTLEVVIPLRPRDGNLTVEGINKHSPDLDHEEIHVDDANDDRSDSVSELSALSSDTDGSDSALSSDTDESESDHYDTKELLGQLAPEGYVPSMETVQEEGRMLVRRLMSVAEWLAVLEWKGMGEA